MDIVREMMDFIDACPTSYHVVDRTKSILKENGFMEIYKEEAWNLKETGKYYLVNEDSAIIAFRVGSLGEDLRFQLIGSHGDSPSFRIKPHSQMAVKGEYIRLNTEVYGGPIFSSWFDRPLSMAGRVILEKEGRLESCLVNIDRDLLVLQNIAIHMNREINKGYAYNPQKDTLPILGMINETLDEGEIVLDLLSEELEVDRGDILDFDLYIYPREKASLVGINEDFVSSARLDNLSMAYLSLKALLDAKDSIATNMVVIYDHEEIGSSSRAGAASPFLQDTLARIASVTGVEAAYYRSLARSFMISADLAHALHPNYTEAADPTNRPILNKGPVIKMAANRSYSTDAYSAARFRQICRKAGVPVQEFANRSDKRGGSTIGAITLGLLDIAMVDVGNGCLGMHSARELVGSKDQDYMYKAFLTFFQD